MVQKYDIVRITATHHEWENWPLPRLHMDQYVGDGRDYMVISVDLGGINIVSLERDGRYSRADGWMWPEQSLTIVEPFSEAEKVICVTRHENLPRHGHSGFSGGVTELGLTVYPLKYVEAGIFGNPPLSRGQTIEFIPLRSIMGHDGRRLIDHRVQQNRDGLVPPVVDLDPEPDEADDVVFDEDEEDDF